MKVAGIDYSSFAIDIVLIDAYTDTPPEWHRYALSGHDAFERARTVTTAMPSKGSAFWDTVLAVGLEEPRGRNSAPIHRVQGAILAAIPGRVLVQPWLPNEWRTAVGLKGNASKDAAAWRSRQLQPRFMDPLCEWPQDAHDAHLIAIATRTRLNQQEAA